MIGRDYSRLDVGAGASNSLTVSPNAAATLTSTASEGFARPDSMRRTCAGSTPIRSAAPSIVQRREARRSRARRASWNTTRRKRAVARCTAVFGVPLFVATGTAREARPRERVRRDHI